MSKNYTKVKLKPSFVIKGKQTGTDTKNKIVLTMPARRIKVKKS